MFRTLKVRSQFIALDENKADLAKFLSEAIVEKGKDLPERYEIVIGGGFIDATDARSMMRDNVRHQGNHEEADTKLMLLLHFIMYKSDGSMDDLWNGSKA